MLNPFSLNICRVYIKAVWSSSNEDTTVIVAVPLIFSVALVNA